MDNQQQNSSQTQEQQNNNGGKKLTGFQLHPENINKNGAPKKEWTWKELIEQAADEDIELKNKLGVVTFRGKRKQAVIKRLFSFALSSDDPIKAINTIMDRTDGKPQQSVDHTSGGDKIEMPILYIPDEK